MPNNILQYEIFFFLNDSSKRIKNQSGFKKNQYYGKKIDGFLLSIGIDCVPILELLISSEISKW